MLARQEKTAVRLGVCLALVVLGVIFAIGFRLPAHLVLQTGDNAYPVGPITPRAAFVQELNITGPLRIASFEVLLATWGKPANTTHDEIRIFDGSSRQVQAMKLPPGSVADNAYVRVDLPDPIEIDGRGRFFVSLSSSDGSAANSITAWATHATAVGRLYSLPGADLGHGSLVKKIDHARPLKGAICVRVLGQGPRRLLAEKALRVGGLLVFLALAACAWWARTLRRWWLSGQVALGLKADVGRASTAWLYLIIALAWGLAMALITPPFQVADEPAHYYRAWSVAQLELVAQPGMVVTLPDNVATLPDRLGSAVIDWTTNHYSAGAARALLWERIAPTSRDQVTSAGSYGPLGYIPQAIGVSVARVLGHSPLLALYFGRFLNLLASVMIVFFAIRTVPFGKPFIALVALLPMFVFQAASLGPDGLALSGFLLFLAITLRLSTRPILQTADLALMACTATVFLNVKPGFVVLVLLVFMLRPRQFGSVRRYVVWVSSTLAAAFGLSALLMLVAPHATAGYLASLGMYGVDQAQQLAFVLRHPWAFAKVLYRTFDQQNVALAQSGYGILGWLSVGLPTVGMFGMTLAAILFMGYRETVRTTLWQRLVICATGVLFVCVVSLALYAGWSAVAAPVVSGLQGRYFIPALALGLFAIYGIRPRRERAILLILVAAVGSAAVTTIARLLSFYY